MTEVQKRIKLVYFLLGFFFMRLVVLWLFACFLLFSSEAASSQNSFLEVLEAQSNVESQLVGSGMPPVFTIDLDLPLTQKWNETISYFSPVMNDMHDYIMGLLWDQLSIPSFVTNMGATLLELYMPFYYDQDFIEEVNAIAELSNIKRGLIFGINFLYDLIAHKACTSIVAMDKNNQIIHGRDLDYLLQDKIPHLMFHGVFQSNGATVFEGDCIAGYLGILTGARRNAYSITLNERNGESFLENLYDIFLTKSVSPPLLVTQVLSQNLTYSQAKEALENTPLTSSAYFIIGGTQPMQGAVVSRETAGVQNVTELSNENWFLCQSIPFGFSPISCFLGYSIIS